MKKILVIDDSATQRNNMEAILTRAGHQVRTASDGNQAVESASAYQPHIIFMDVNMPGTDGFAATRELRANPETKNIPIVFLTSKGQKADKAWGQILGAAGYLVKPCDEADVVSEVTRIVG